MGDPGLIPWSGRSPGEGNVYPLQYSFLENSIVRGAWRTTVLGVTKSWTWLSDFYENVNYFANWDGRRLLVPVLIRSGQSPSWDLLSPLVLQERMLLACEICTLFCQPTAQNAQCLLGAQWISCWVERKRLIQVGKAESLVWTVMCPAEHFMNMQNQTGTNRSQREQADRGFL